MLINGVEVNKPRKNFSIVTRRDSFGEKFFFIAMAIFCAIYAFSLTFPVVWLFLKSIEDTGMYDMNRFLYGWLYVAPLKDWKLGQYVRAFTELQLDGLTFAGMLTNSAWWVGIGTFQSIFWHLPLLISYLSIVSKVETSFTT